MCPQLRTTGLVAMASDSTAEGLFPSSQTILLDSLVYRSSSCWPLYNENLIPTKGLGMNFLFVSRIESAHGMNKSYLINGAVAGLEEFVSSRKGMLVGQESFSLASEPGSACRT